MLSLFSQLPFPLPMSPLQAWLQETVQCAWSKVPSKAALLLTLSLDLYADFPTDFILSIAQLLTVCKTGI